MNERGIAKVVRIIDNSIVDALDATLESDRGESGQPPLVTVVIPAFNAATFIARTLNSVLTQTYKFLEVIVIDDCSSDRTVEIVRKFSARDERIILLQQSSNLGVAASRNLGIRKARGELIAPIDADDLWQPQHLEKQVAMLQNSDSNVGVVYSWSVDIDEADRPIGEFRVADIEGDVYATLLCHNFIGNASATLLRRQCLEEIGGYSGQLLAQQAQGCEDWDLYLRLAERYRFRVVPEFSIGYRKIRGSMSRDFRRMARSHALMLQTVRQRNPNLPVPLYRLSQSSLYLYFANQNEQCGNDLRFSNGDATRSCNVPPGETGLAHRRETLYWLYRALRADCITPLVRFGFYVMALRSTVGIVAARLGLQALAAKRKPAKVSSPSGPFDFTPHSLSVRLRLSMGQILHSLIPVLYRQP